MNMMNPMMSVMNDFDNSLQQEQQEMNQMMSNHGSMDRMHTSSRKRDYPSRNEDHFDIPAKKPYSQPSTNYREPKTSLERPSRYVDTDRGFSSSRDEPRRGSPIGRINNPLGLSGTRNTRREEDIEDEIAKYEKELQLLKRMKELKEERRRALNEDKPRRDASPGFSSYGMTSRSDYRGGAYGRESSLDRNGDRYNFDRKDRYGVASRGRSPVRESASSKYGDVAASKTRNPMMGSAARTPYAEKGNHGSYAEKGNHGSYDPAKDRSALSNSVSSAARGKSSYGYDKEKLDSFGTKDKLDSWTSLAGTRPGGSSYRYDGGLSSSYTPGLSGNGSSSYMPGLSGSSALSGLPSSGGYGTSSFTQSNSSNRGSHYPADGTTHRFDSRRWN